MSVMLCTGATFVKKNSCLVARIVSFDTVGLHLLTFRILAAATHRDFSKPCCGKDFSQPSYEA